MENNSKLIKIIKKEIQENKNLEESLKWDALYLLDMATDSLGQMEINKVIIMLEEVYKNTVYPDYKEALLYAIKDYKLRLRQYAFGRDATKDSVTLRDFLEEMRIPTSNIPDEKLDMKLVVGEDDGMGYTPNGFLNVTGAYPDEDGTIKLWI